MVDRIEIDPRVCNGNPVIRGTRIPVAVILDHLAADQSWESILDGFPELTREDIAAALVFAREFLERHRQEEFSNRLVIVSRNVERWIDTKPKN